MSRVRRSKYGAERTNGYASKHEAMVAADLHFLEKAGKIQDLREQVPFVLIQGRNGVRSITYIADFTYCDNGRPIVADAKGYRTEVYKLKKKMLYLLCGIEITEL